MASLAFTGGGAGARRARRRVGGTAHAEVLLDDTPHLQALRVAPATDAPSQLRVEGGDDARREKYESWKQASAVEATPQQARLLAHDLACAPGARTALRRALPASVVHPSSRNRLTARRGP